VVLEGWLEAEKPPILIASVGSSTTTALVAGGLQVVFEPSKATAATLAAELPVKTRAFGGGCFFFGRQFVSPDWVALIILAAIKIAAWCSVM
jgi:hypothetical protein